MIPVVAVAIFFAVQVPQTGILLTLAFDLMLAGLIVPFVAAHLTTRVTTAAAVAAMAAGLGVRLVLFVLTPTMYGVPNTVLYIDNSLIGPGFDGWPTFFGLFASLLAFLAALAVHRLRSAGTKPVATTAPQAPLPAPEPVPQHG